MRVASFLRLAAFVPVVFGGGYLLFALPSAPAISVIQAVSESVAFHAIIPEMAQIRLTGFAVTYEAPDAGLNLGFRDTVIPSSTYRRPLCLDGVVAPEPGAKVTYKRFGSGAVSVVIEHAGGQKAASFQILGKEPGSGLRQASWVRLEGKSQDSDKDVDDNKRSGKGAVTCPGSPVQRLPIYGAAEIGEEIRPASAGGEQSGGVLIEGTLDVFARAIELVPWNRNEPRLYPGSVSTITLPPGSRVIEFTANDAPALPWIGFVRTDADEALGVKVTTPAMKLAIVRPGVGMQPEVFSVGLFTQLANDPVLMAVQISAALIFAVLQALGAGLSFLAGPWGRSDRRASVTEMVQTEAPFILGADDFARELDRRPDREL
ncbi:hypothetical protein [Rhodopseudomonas palustris]|uniref:hypothetical protein n=1 Tax=Rhodopseudomonas palustris TaxID=1076 RepID=UPI0021F39A79|nr:hypothetical protein [Rhodopseudomonas palustris]UYO55606.1 hypothetical protein KQX61_09480 [Rhodopseudomonas palustris]